MISPFWSLALSESTCLWNKLTLEILKLSFLDLKIKSKYAEVVSRIVCCSTFLRDKLAFWVSSSDFLNVFNPLKPEKIFYGILSVSICTVINVKSYAKNFSLLYLLIFRAVIANDGWWTDFLLILIIYCYVILIYV